jgi:hypothetical protein
MYGIEKAYGNAVIQALLHANGNVMQSTVDGALRVTPRYGKSDTLGLDAISEISIGERVKEHDQHAVLITEEQNNWPGFYSTVPADPNSFRTFFISDPTDRSADFANFLGKVKDKRMRVFDAMKEAGARAQWEADSSAPCSITGPFCAITCIRRGVPIFSAFVNYLTQEMYMACTAGVFKIPVNYGERPMESLTVDLIRSEGEHVDFSIQPKTYEGMKNFVTFLGAEGKAGYLENFQDSHLMEDDDLEKRIIFRKPGGPSRILYLSAMFGKNQDIGFVLANGEKITEWIHWITFVRFARSARDLGEPVLHMYEVWHPRPHTKEGVLMSTSPNYSIFRQLEGGGMVIDLSIFQRFVNPSKIRSTLLVCLNSNSWVQQMVQRYGYRKIQF